jgi:AcrR family transcriptional regulator
MSRDVKPARPYHSPRRRQQAESTRRDILDAARRLFEQRGYGSTTMAAIADEAGVAVKTVYLAFDTKSRLLRALWHLLLRGDDGDAPVAERDWYRQMIEEPDPEQQLRLNARNSRAAKQRIGGVLEVIRAAASTDDEAQALWQRIETEYHANQHTIVESLHQKDALRPELDVGRATDILWTINHPTQWQLLVRGRGWSPEQYERWCAELACAQLLRPPKTKACTSAPSR